MTDFERQLGWINDATAGGKDYDALTTGAVPGPDFWAPVDNANVNRNPVQLNRNQEVRGFRGSVAPIEFRQDPRVSFEATAYPLLLKRLVKLFTGDVDTKVGTPPASIAHGPFEPIQEGELPAVHLSMARDAQWDKVSGAVLNELALAFSMGDFAKVSGEFWGKYAKRETGEPPATSFTGYERRGYLLRDLAIFLDGSGTDTIPLTALSLNFSNNISDAVEDRFARRRNIVRTTYDAVVHDVWWPYRHKFLSHSATGSLTLADPVPDEDLKLGLAHAEQMVIEVLVDDLSTTPPARELLRITAPVIVRTGGGPEALTDEDSISASYDFMMAMDPATGADFKFEFVDATNVLIP